MATANATSSGGVTASADSTTSATLTLDTVNEDDLSPAELKKYKELQADYTRKTQALAEERKALEALKEESEEYKAWWQNNQEGIQAYQRWQEEQANADPAAVEDVYDDATSMEDISRLKKEYEAKLKDMQTEYAQAMQQGYNQIKQLTEIKIADPEADWDKILKTARENNLVDMNKAYNLTYDEKLTKKKIEDAVKQREKEIEEKVKTQVLTQTQPLGREVRKVTPRTRGR